VDTGIESVREILSNCVFDEEKCSEGISHLESYRKEWDDKRGCWKDKPLHDFTSHGADGFRYFAVAKNNRKAVGAFFF
ncbi:terminase, partial [Xenorhabdus bovienii]